MWKQLLVGSVLLAFQSNEAVWASGAPAIEGLWQKGPFEATPQEIIQVVSELPVPENADIEYLNRHSDYRYDVKGRQAFSRYVLFRILTEEGLDSYSAARRIYAPWHQERPEIRYRVISPGGEETWLEPRTLSESPVESSSEDIFEDRRLLEAPLPALEVGAIVEGVRTLVDREPFFDAGTTVINFLQSSGGPIRRDLTTFRVPQGTKPRYAVKLMDGLEPRVSEAGDTVVYEFETRDVGRDSEFEAGMPPELPRWSYVGFTTGRSWQDVAARYSDLVDSRIAGAEIAAIPRGESAGTTRQRIAEILAWVHGQVRYTGLELGAASIVPADPTTTLRRRFGDCKDKATLLTALLRREGIEAYVALLRAGRGADLDPALPGLGRMNHAITYLPEEDLWIDPTDPQSRAGELPLADQARWALIASATTDGLVKTPASTADDNRRVVSATVFLSPHGNAKVEETEVFHGSLENQMRSALEQLSAEDLKEAYEAFVENRYMAKELGEIRHNGLHDLSEQLTINLDVREAARGVTDLQSAVFAIRTEDLFADFPQLFKLEPEEDEDSERKHEYFFYEPYSVEWRFDLRSPRGMKARALPEDEEVLWAGGGFRRSSRETEQGIEVVYVLDSGARRLAPREFDDVKRKVVTLAEREADLYWFDHVALADLEAGRTVQAISGFLDLVDSDRTDALNRARFAHVLVKLGLGTEARRVAEEAVKLAPDSAVALWAQATVLQHDEIGRLHTDGADIPKARRLMNRAAELEPEDRTIRYEQAVLQDYDDRGVRYSTDAPLDVAVQHYRRFREDFGESELDGNLLFSLLYTGRWGELVEEAEIMPPEAIRDSLLVSATVLTVGLEKGLETAEQLASGQEQFTQLMVNAASQLAAVRKYSEAADLLSRAATGSEDPSAVMNQAGILRRAKMLDLGSAPESVESLVQHFFDANSCTGDRYEPTRTLASSKVF